MKESVHMDINISSEDHPNQYIEIEEEEKTTQEAPQKKSNGK